MTQREWHEVTMSWARRRYERQVKGGDGSEMTRLSEKHYPVTMTKKYPKRAWLSFKMEKRCYRYRCCLGYFKCYLCWQEKKIISHSLIVDCYYPKDFYIETFFFYFNSLLSGVPNSNNIFVKKTSCGADFSIFFPWQPC